MESSSSSSSRRARISSNVVHCLVDGCEADLSLCRDYHRRHKVCEVHAKTPNVTICNKEQRFCQQCSRFHSLGEFDDGKRSCRKRLDWHNKRRRKAQPDSSLANAHILPSSIAAASSNWLPGFMNPRTNMCCFKVHGSSCLNSRSGDSHHALSLLSSGSQTTKQFSFRNHMVQIQNGAAQINNYDCFSPFHNGIRPVTPVPQYNDTTLYFPEMFHHGEAAASSSNEPHETLPFIWD